MHAGQGTVNAQYLLLFIYFSCAAVARTTVKGNTHHHQINQYWSAIYTSVDVASYAGCLSSACLACCWACQLILEIDCCSVMHVCVHVVVLCMTYLIAWTVLVSYE
jgi:hypothetical protein